MRYFQTVTGRKPETDMGVTTTHEHLLWDQRCYLPTEPESLSERAFMHRPVAMGDLGRIRYHMHKHVDNLVQTDPEEAIGEAREFRLAGGGTLCDCSCWGLGRDPKAIRRIALATGLNILMGTGLYIEAAHPARFQGLPAQELADLMTRELTQGTEDTDIKAGFIGEIGVSTFSEAERRVLAAAAAAQKNTGAALIIHQPGLEPLADAILDELERGGADLGRVIMGHSDIFENNLPYLENILRRGANIAFDQFGIEIAIDYRIWLPRDIDRVRAIARLSERGFGDRIVLGQDVCFKVSYKKYGGWGYSHLLDNVIPIMEAEGFGRDDIRRLLQDNPRRLLCTPGAEG